MSSDFVIDFVLRDTPSNFSKLPAMLPAGRAVLLFVRIEMTTITPWPNEEERNGPPHPAPQSHLFRSGRAAPGAQHHHRVDVRGRQPLSLHDARRLRAD